MHAGLRRFRLRPSPGVSPTLPTTGGLDQPSPSPTFSQTQFRVHDDPTPSKHTVGSYEYDLECGKYQKQWKDWQQFEEWLVQEQADKTVEFGLANTYKTSNLYTRKLYYVCSRAGTGGIKNYVKLHPEWQRKRGPKRTNCPCTLTVKEYPGRSTVLGQYLDVHNHELGNGNLPYTRIPKEARERIAGLLRMKVTAEHIVSLLSIISLSSTTLTPASFS